MQPLTLSSTDRVLVLAPHPDDETLACGALIQAALAVGAAVRVLFATDGDDNPWPQRWVEWRLRIGPADRARWGARRRSEAVAALAALGVRDPSAYRFFGWPDQGLTDAVMTDDAAVAAIAAEIDAFAPTHVAAPTLGDRHPDHSALRVITELALARGARRCTLLGYVVHRLHAQANAGIRVGDEASRAVKQHAMRSHASQLALSGRRLLAIAAAPEQFDIASANAPPSFGDAILRIRPHARWPLRGAHDLLLVVAESSNVSRYRGRVPPALRQGDSFALTCANGTSLTAQWTGDELVVQCPALEAATARFAKLHRLPPRLVVFDREPWHAQTVVPRLG